MMRRSNKGTRFTTELTNKQAGFFITAILVVFGVFYAGVSKQEAVLATVRAQNRSEVVLHMPSTALEEIEVENVLANPYTVVGIDCENNVHFHILAHNSRINKKRDFFR